MGKDACRRARRKHTTTTFGIEGGRVIFDSCFDGGNLARVECIERRTFALDPAFDFQDHGSSKTFFHFSVMAPAGTRLKLVIRNLTQLQHFTGEDSYRPYFRKSPMVEYQRLQFPVRLVQASQSEVVFQWLFQLKETVYFAFSNPYSYSRYLQLVERVKQMGDRANLYAQALPLAKSVQGRPVYMFTISSPPTSQLRDQLPNDLFLQAQNNPAHFGSKPCIMITGRVHPGESPASFLAQQIVKLLLDEEEQISKTLRKNFVFYIVPMLNPDGVFHGHYRFDLQGHNLNRFYKNPSRRKHPSVFAAKCLMQHLATKRTLFYFDLHAHPWQSKGIYLYGNALDTFRMHCQNVLFSKLLERSDPNLQHQFSIFSKKQMRAAEEPLEGNKEGCGRVNAYKLFNIAHAYTIELGFHSTSHLRAQRQFIQIQQIASFGKTLLASVLRLMGLAASPISIEQLRKQMALKLYFSQERFRMAQRGLLKSIKAGLRPLHEVVAPNTSPRRRNQSPKQRNISESHPQDKRQKTQPTNNFLKTIKADQKGQSKKDFLLMMVGAKVNQLSIMDFARKNSRNTWGRDKFLRELSDRLQPNIKKLHASKSLQLKTRLPAIL